MTEKSKQSKARSYEGRLPRQPSILFPITIGILGLLGLVGVVEYFFKF
jgi:hypothetical protein